MIKPTNASTPEEYIAQIDEPRRTEIARLHGLITKAIPKMKPTIYAGMIGYGLYHFKYASGREGDWPVVALASQKNYISVYVCASEDGKYCAESRKSELPKASIGKSCIRFKKLADVDTKVLISIVKEGVKVMAKNAKAGKGVTIIS
ncbi:MAG: DUF1801 domain-containing protein [Bryobacterales bacterium]|nr:DUF1801 domain-containing protein [Bryobacterales bacterium]